MKTIAFLYPTLFHPQRGGVERVTDLLAKELIQRSYRVIYLHNKKNDNLMNYAYPAPLFFFPKEGYDEEANVAFYHQFIQEQKVDIIINQCGNFGDSHLYLSIGNNIKTKTISVLHSNPTLNYNYLAEEVLKLRNKTLKEKLKLIARFLIYQQIKKSYWDNRINHFEYLFNHTDIVCLLSDLFRDEIKRVYASKTTKIRAIANPNPFSNQKPIEKKKKQLLYVGRLTKGEKRPDRLLKIWNKLYADYPDWELIIIGDGPERKALEKEATRMSRIKFMGFQDPMKYYQTASIFCMTSNFEGFPMVLIEAMTFGTIPIAFQSFASITDIIKNEETGILIPPFSINKYVEELRKLMNNETLRSTISIKCQTSVQQFSIENIANQWEELFKELEQK